MSRTLAVCVTHAPWIPERAARMEKLRATITAGLLPGEQYYEETSRPTDEEKATGSNGTHIWAETQWKWGVSTDADSVVFLQDDIEIPDNFMVLLRAVIEAQPDEMIGLEAVHQAGRALKDERGAWYTTADGVIGVGYVFPKDALRAFLKWRSEELVEGGKEAITEDTLVGCWTLATNRKVWHPVPTVIDHDTTMPSSYGNDAHPMRRPSVTWKDYDMSLVTGPGWWAPGAKVHHLGRLYEATPNLCAQWVKNWTPERHRVAMRDDGRRTAKVISAQMRANLPDTAIPTIVIATPTKQHPHAAYSSTVWMVRHDEAVEVVDSHETMKWWMMSQDVARVRARYVRAFLNSGASHLWFLDDDVSCDPIVLRGMLAAKRDFVACPYPVRTIDWPAVENEEDIREPAEARGYRYNMQLPPGPPPEIDKDACCEILRIGLGCSLISRECLLRMSAHYSRPEPDRAYFEAMAARVLSQPMPLDGEGIGRIASLLMSVREDAIANPPVVFDDELAGIVQPTVGLFNFSVRRRPNGFRELPSEDVAFCDRWRAMGGKIFMYVGTGAPATHHGDYAFKGMQESLGIRPIEEKGAA
jgi:hypothetical protein